MKGLPESAEAAFVAGSEPGGGEQSQFAPPFLKRVKHASSPQVPRDRRLKQHCVDLTMANISNFLPFSMNFVKYC